MDNIFVNVFKSSEGIISISFSSFLICIIGSLIAGLIISCAYMVKNEYSKGYVVTLVLLPSIVAGVIMMVNGNLGAGVAVAGAFSLVRFRSAQGTAKEICSIFLAMATGLAMGMGYIGVGILFALIISLAFVVLAVLPFGEMKENKNRKILKITIPEDLDYTNVFNEIFAKYMEKSDLVQVKTTNLGSMFKLTYEVVLKDASEEKELVDKIRCRNGNLEVLVSRVVSNVYEL